MRAVAVLLPLALVACTKAAPPPEPQDTGIPDDLPDMAAPKLPQPSDPGAATPMKDRVAKIGVLNKRNYLQQTFEMKPGESKRFGDVVVRLAACERTAPWEWPRQTGAFTQVFVRRAASAGQAIKWNKVFSGWLFKESPSLNVVQDPVYDVWVEDCAMSWSGETPKPSASASSAANDSGNDAASSAPATASNSQ